MTISSCIQKAKTSISEFKACAIQTLGHVKQKVSSAGAYFRAALPQVMASRKSYRGLKSDVRAVNGYTVGAISFACSLGCLSLGLMDSIKNGDAVAAAEYGVAVGGGLSGLGMSVVARLING